MDDKDVFCVSCGEAIVINLDMIDQIIECPGCHTRLRLDEATENDSGENDIEWSPDVDAADATRVFGMIGKPEPDESHEGGEGFAVADPIIPPPGAASPVGSRFSISEFFALAAISGLGWFFVQETQRTARLEERLEFIENEVIPMKRSLADSADALSQITDIQNYLDELDDTVSQIASEFRLQKATSLQNEYSLQSTQKNLIRQETEFGKLALKLALVEQTAADKSRNAKEAFELSVQRRREAEIAAKPIRHRIRELEEQKKTLFSQYRAGSIAKYPQGVVSKGRATKLMKDYERKTAPLLEQIQEEISKVREAIEAEEAKIELLYQE
jgi:hypothetical protein